MPADRRRKTAVGFTVKSGWACAVLVSGTPSAPAILDSRRIELSDPAVRNSRQPYHAGFATARRPGPALSRLLASVRRHGGRSVGGLLREYGRAGHRVAGAGIVTGSLIDPARIANEHIRIHAMEGRLFRTVVERASSRGGLRPRVYRERDLLAAAATTLHRTERSVRALLDSFRGAVPGPWRAEQKSAALAAILCLSRGSNARRAGGVRAARGVREPA